MEHEITTTRRATVGAVGDLARESTAVMNLARESTAVMPRRECLARLALEPVGRLVVPRDGLPPVVLPAIYRLAGDELLVRTAHALPPAREHPRRLILEVDRIEVDRRRGWSVVVECVVREGSPRNATAADAGWLWLSIDAVRGRRLGAGAPPDPGTVW